MKAAVPRSRYLIFLSIAGLGCAVDLWTKRWIFDRLGMPDFDDQGNPLVSPIWIVKPIFSLTTSLNTGALFGIGQGQGIIFAALSVVAAIGIVYWLFVSRAAKDALLTVALGCVMAGILGNLYDRLGLPGLRWNRGHQIGKLVCAVRDWMHFEVQAINLDWPVFNVADSLLVCGAALLVLHAFRLEVAAAKVAADKPVDAN